MSIALYNRNGMPTLFRDLLGDARCTSHPGQCHSPAVDIKESGETLTFVFELPGVSKDDIRLEYKEGILSLTAEKKAVEDEDDDVRYFTRERRQGSFGRSFRIGTAYDPTTVAAKFDNGLLTVTVAKKEDARPVSIQVQ